MALRRVLAVLVLFVPAPALAVDLPVTFDFGPRGAEVQAGALEVQPADTYSAILGFGLQSPARGGWDWDGAVLMNLFGKSLTADTNVVANHPNGTSDFADDAPDPDRALRVDDVFDGNALTFLVDLPNGTYDVTVWLGDMIDSLYFVDVRAEGRLVATDVHAYTDTGRLVSNPRELGGSQRRTFTTEVRDGQLTLELGELDGSAGPERIRVDEEVFPGRTVTFDGDLFVDDPESRTGSAYKGVALQAVRIARHEPDPVRLEDGVLVSDVTDEDLQAGLVDFAAGDYEAALAHFRDMPQDGAAGTAKALALLWVAGRPEMDSEVELLEEAYSLVATADPSDENADRWRRVLWDLRVAYAKMALFGYGGFSAAYRYMSAEQHLRQVVPGDAFYEKALIRIARTYCGLDPKGNLGYYLGKKILEDVEERFPENEYVRLFVHREWGPPDWEVPMPDVDVPDAPAWAVSELEAFDLALSFLEWWTENRQNEIGEYGGGFGDDVEIVVPLIEYVLLAQDDASPVLTAGVRRFLDSLWADPHSIDPETGFFPGYGDAEHVSEYTGDATSLLTPMLYGEPLWLERNMRTASRFGEAWSDVTDLGHRHFHGMFLGPHSAGAPGGGPGNEEAICMRALQNAHWVLWYNDNPTLEALYEEYATATAEDALRTDKGKPEGVPAPIAFDGDEIGGHGSDWWGGPSVWFRFPSYVYYPLNLLGNVYLRTGDDTYLEPLLAAADLATETVGLPDGAAGTREWAGQSIAQQVASTAIGLARSRGLTDFDDLFAAMEENERWYWTRKGWTLDPTRADALVEAVDVAVDNYVANWPFWTTEALMTDRIAGGGELDSVSAMMGSDAYTTFTGLTSPGVSYRGSDRRVAARAMDVRPERLDVLVYSFADARKDFGIRPWRLEHGATYHVRVGPDADEDGTLEEVSYEADVVHEHRGDVLWVPVPPRETTRILAERTERGEAALRADLAIGIGDIAVSDGSVSVRVHNLGSVDAPATRVDVHEGPPWLGRLLGSAEVAALEAPVDLAPRMRSVRVDADVSGCTAVWATVDADGAVDQITEENDVEALVLGAEGCNRPPIAAAEDAAGEGGELVDLDGTASSDPDGDPLFFHWRQIAGPSATIDDPSIATPTITLPDTEDAVTLTLELRVSDGALEDSDLVFVSVSPGGNGGDADSDSDSDSDGDGDSDGDSEGVARRDGGCSCGVGAGTPAGLSLLGLAALVGTLRRRRDR